MVEYETHAANQRVRRVENANDDGENMAAKGDVLKQLLEELLSSVDDVSPVTHGASTEVLDINKQLIELIVNAGLLALVEYQRPLESLHPFYTVS